MELRTFDDLIVTDLRDDLSDPEFAVGYLQMCLDEAQAHDDIGIFLVALRNVAKARESVAELAEKAGKTRSSFYKSLSSLGNPEFATILRTLPALGLKFQLVTHPSGSVETGKSKTRRKARTESVAA